MVLSELRILKGGVKHHRVHTVPKARGDAILTVVPRGGPFAHSPLTGYSIPHPHPVTIYLSWYVGSNRGAKVLKAATPTTPSLYLRARQTSAAASRGCVYV